MAPPGPVSPSPLVRKSFGEPRFHSDGDLAALAFAPDGTLRSVDDTSACSATGRRTARPGTVFSQRPGNALGVRPVRCDTRQRERRLLVLGRRRRPVVGPNPPTGVGNGLGVWCRFDGRTLASGHDNGLVRFWDVASRRFVGEIQAHSELSLGYRVRPGWGASGHGRRRPNRQNSGTSTHTNSSRTSPAIPTGSLPSPGPRTGRS